MRARRRQQEWRERARRELVERATRRPVWELPPARAAEVWGWLDANRLSWAQLGERAGRQVIYLADADTKPPAGVRVLDARSMDWDRLIRPFAAAARGHASYAHTRQHALYEFGTAYDPFDHGDNADWTGYAIANSGDDYFKSAGGLLTQRAAPGASTRAAIYRWDAEDMSGVSADYSVEANIACTYSGTADDKVFGVALRAADGNNCYLAVIRYSSPAGSWAIQMWRRVASAWTRLGSNVNISGASGLIRIEAVGSALKAYWGGSETEKISASDASISAAGYPAIYGGLGDGSTSSAPTADDVKVYVVRTGRPAALVGPLAGRRQPGFGLAR